MVTGSVASGDRSERSFWLLTWPSLRLAHHFPSTHLLDIFVTELHLKTTVNKEQLCDRMGFRETTAPISTAHAGSTCASASTRTHPPLQLSVGCWLSSRHHLRPEPSDLEHGGQDAAAPPCGKPGQRESSGKATIGKRRTAAP